VLLTPDGQSYWPRRVFSLGDAAFFGSEAPSPERPGGYGHGLGERVFHRPSGAGERLLSREVVKTALNGKGLHRSTWPDGPTTPW
jgi:hypothetical protein